MYRKSNQTKNKYMANITVEVTKLDVTNEKKEVVRSMYTLTIANGKEEVKMSVGKTTYEGIKKMLK